MIDQEKETHDGKCIGFFTGGRAMDLAGTAYRFLLRASDSQKGKSESAEGDYAVDGMCIGMCVGMTVGSLIGDGNGGLGTSLGMLIGLAIGLSIPRKSEKGQQQKKGQK